MSDSQQMELWRSHHAMQEKIVHFLMASAGACIGFALSQVKDLLLDRSHVALGLALLLWASSFWFGFRRVQLALGVIWSNGDLLKIKSGKHPKVGSNPSHVAAATDMVNSYISEQSSSAVASERLQVVTLILGVASYVVWQLLLMLQRSA